MKKLLIIMLAASQAATAQHRATAQHLESFWVPTRTTACAKADSTKGMIFLYANAPGKPVMDSLRKYCAAGVHQTMADTTFAFENGQGELLYVRTGPATDDQILAGLLIARDRNMAIRQRVIYESQRLLGDTDENKLEYIIAERTKEKLQTDSLLDTYVVNLPIDSATSPRILRFLALQAPVLNSLANQLLRQDPEKFTEVWKSLSIADRVRINNEVIEKTVQKAALDTNEDEATLAATFAAGTNQGPIAKVRAFQGIKLEYFYDTGDTLRFLELAGTYYDRFLMHLDADSLRVQDSIQHRPEAFSVAKFVGEQLNKGAERVDAMSHNPALWRQALTWADEAVAMYPAKELKETSDRLRAKLKSP